MAKTKTVTQKAWGVFMANGKLARLNVLSSSLITTETEKSALEYVNDTMGETVRPVTLSWEVEE